VPANATQAFIATAVAHERARRPHGAPRQALPALPAARKWENDALTPTSGVEYVEEDRSCPPGGRLYGARVGGTVMDEGLYSSRWWGSPVAARRRSRRRSARCSTASRPAPAIAASDGSVVRVKGDVIPWRTEITNPSDSPAAPSRR
jgi:hypothetical protein